MYLKSQGDFFSDNTNIEVFPVLKYVCFLSSQSTFTKAFDIN